MQAQTRLARYGPALILALGVACARAGTNSLPSPLAMSAVGDTTVQEANVGSAVPNAPAVRLVDGNRSPMVGVNVIFTATSGGGRVEGGTAKTDVNGVASVAKWTLGTTAGVNALEARAGDLSVTFRARGLPGAPSVLVKGSPDPQRGVAGSAVAAAPSVVVQDAHGNPLPRVRVLFSVTDGHGSVTGAIQQTSESGVATLGSWTLGKTSGLNTVTVFVAGTPRVSFSAMGTAGPPATLVVAPAGVWVAPRNAEPLKAHLADRYGNVVGPAPSPTFASANRAVATVSRSGLVSGVAVGNTTVRVTSGAATTMVPVYVSAGGHPTGLSRVDTPEGGRPFAVRVSAGGVLLVGEQDNDRLGRYDLPSTASAGTIAAGDDPTDVAFSVDGRKAYVTNQASGTLGVIDVASNAQIENIPTGSAPFRVAPSRDGSKIYVTTANGALVTVSTTTSTTASLALRGALNGLAVHPRQPLLYVTSTSGALYEVSETTGLLLRSVWLNGSAQEVVVSPDGTRLYIAIEDGPLEIRATSDLGLVATIPEAAGTFGAALTPDGTQLFATQPSAHRVQVIDVATRQVLRTIDGGVPRRVTFDRGGFTAIIGNEAGYVSFVK